jgi:hypothetical protein
MKRATLKLTVIETIGVCKRNKKKPANTLKQPIHKKPLPLKVGVSLFIGISLFGVSLGATVGSFIFFGVITLMGLIAITESNSFIYYLVKKSNKAIDLILFAFTIYATISLGLMMTASLSIAGLGFSLVYGP